MNQTQINSLVLAAVLSAPSLLAGTNGFYVPSFRGASGTDVSGWDRFTSGATIANLPDLLGSTTATRATLTQLDPIGAVLGSGNLYVGFGTGNFNIAYNNSKPIAEINLQIRTLGTEMDYSGLRLNFTGAQGAVSLPASGRILNETLAQPAGKNISIDYTWTLSDPTVKAFNVTFKSSGEHLSLDAVTLDVRSQGAVPEPAAWALACLGVGALAWSIRRR